MTYIILNIEFCLTKNYLIQKIVKIDSKKETDHYCEYFVFYHPGRLTENIIYGKDTCSKTFLCGLYILLLTSGGIETTNRPNKVFPKIIENNTRILYFT